MRGGLPLPPPPPPPLWHLSEATAQPWAAATKAIHVCLRFTEHVSTVPVCVCVSSYTYIILLVSHEEAEAPSVALVPRLVRRTYQSPPGEVYSLLQIAADITLVLSRARCHSKGGDHHF